jgi:hypothetical protein
MADFPRDPGTVRATRIEVVDDEGNLRATLGPLPTPDQDRPMFGLALLGDDGRPRVWLSVDSNGPTLAFDLAGNVVLEAGVWDPTLDNWSVGSYIQLSDLDGTPSTRLCAVEDAGGKSLRMEEPQAAD